MDRSLLPEENDCIMMGGVSENLPENYEVRLGVSGADCLLTLKHLHFVCTLCLTLCSPEQIYVNSHPVMSFHLLPFYSHHL